MGTQMNIFISNCYSKHY